jgi:hypothetical protein
MRRLFVVLLVLAPLLLRAETGFDPVNDVPATVSDGVLTLSVPRGVHLKAQLFHVVLASRGALQLGHLPPPMDQDEAGEPIWRGTVRVTLTGRDLGDPVRLVITYQPCTEGKDGVCFLPVKRPLTVPRADIPQEAP